MKRTCVLFVGLIVSLLCSSGAAQAGDGVVTKVAESFEAVPWQVDVWAKARGKTTLSDQVPPGTDSKKSLEVEVQFSGQGFEWFGVTPTVPLVVPGDLKTVSLRCRSNDPRCVLLLKFRDGWGRTETGKTKLEWPLPIKAADQWTTAQFNVPADWVRPLTLDGVGTHNWEFQNEARTIRFWLDHIEVTTDSAQVDADTGLLKTWRPNAEEKDPKKQLKEPPRTPLVAAEISTPEPSAVFSRTEPSACVSVRNWKPGKLAGKVTCQVQDGAGRSVLQQEQPLTVDSSAALALPLKVERFGLYNLTVTLALDGVPPRTKKMGFARQPAQRELTEAAKLATPYGLNFHGGNEKLRLEPFRAAGLVWFRDYAWAYDWLLRAKGADKKYAGWPFYPTMMQRYQDSGGKILACLMKSVTPPEVKDGKVTGRIGPDRAWAMEIADVISAFPQITHWELGNEYDLEKKHADAEEPIQWSNYRAYHKRFGDILAAIGGGELVAVENGRAGIWPERDKACIASGDFATIAVINSHHYCGVEPPELNYGNFNTGFETLQRDEAPALFFDRLRAVKRAACADGKARQSWLTEFGWDTLAGNVVTPYEQAAYLQRAWMLALAAGTDKCFWFFDYDAAAPSHFFDGCGLLAADAGPKLSLCAMAGLTALLPAPKYVGEISAGDNTWGYVFENEGKLVAALWTVQGDAGPEVSFQAEQLYDYLGNKLPGRSAKLRLAPTYVVGLSKDDPLYKQTAYSLDTPYLVVATAGDQVTPVLQVQNNRAAALQATVKMTLPAGWTAAAQEFAVQAAPGEKKTLPMPFTVGPQETLGQKAVCFTVVEGERLKDLALQVLVQNPLIMQVGPILGTPGKAEVTVKLGNQSASPVAGVLRLQLPASWKALTPEQKIEDLKPYEIREVKCSFEWNTDWKPDEKALAAFAATDGKTVQRAIIPKSYFLHKAPALKLDGKLDDWPAACEFPQWILGTSLGEARARVFVGWSTDGIYGAVEVHDSQVSTADPRSFWNGDCLELFLDTADDKSHREFRAGDHQFWFVPQVKENRVYAGRWKRKDEIPETIYDLPGVKSAAMRTDDGYVMEFLLPAAALQNYRPEIGARLGLNLNLTVKGQRFSREVYWPWTKADWALANWPKMWGTVQLAE
ncbi:MAG: hypothetical protein NTW87_18550 [Planctomycetota bacterium]|nr:hypothetical protein [Planctomycetota bacterium]